MAIQHRLSKRPNNYARIVGLMAGGVYFGGWAYAQEAWPSRTITLIVPYAAGGYTDLVGRLTARYVQRTWGRAVVVDNRTGAGGIIGTQAVASATPDGYTFCVCSIGAISIAPFDPKQRVGYDPVRDLIPIGIVSSITQAIIVKKDLPTKSIAEFVSYARANPGRLNYGSSGAGGLTHYSVELFELRAGVRAVHVPFRGGAPATAAVVGGEVDFSFANMTDALPQIEAGTVRGLAVTSLSRSPYLPDLPSLHETVLPNFIVETWNGIMAPPKTSASVIRTMSETFLNMAEDAEVVEAMRKAGASTVKSTPDQFRAQIQQEIEQWKPLMKELAGK
jgi:tripartite-type tricarboxylate transporter receptor subunit TctC